MKAIDLQWKTDADTGLIYFFVDGVEFTAWSYEESPMGYFEEFCSIVELGRNESKYKIDKLLELNKELVEDLELLLKASKNKELPPPFWVNDAQAKAEAILFEMKELKNG